MSKEDDLKICAAIACHQIMSLSSQMPESLSEANPPTLVTPTESSYPLEANPSPITPEVSTHVPPDSITTWQQPPPPTWMMAKAEEEPPATAWLQHDLEDGLVDDLPLDRGRFLGLLSTILGFRTLLEDMARTTSDQAQLVQILLTETFQNGCNPYLSLIRHIQISSKEEAVVVVQDTFTIQMASTCFQALLQFEATTQDLALDWIVLFRSQIQDYLTFLVSSDQRSLLIRTIYKDAMKLNFFRTRTIEALVHSVRCMSDHLKAHPRACYSGTAAGGASAPMLLSALRDVYQSVGLFSATDKKGLPKETKSFKRSKSEVQVRIPCPKEKAEKLKWKKHLLRWQEKLQSCTEGLSLTQDEFCTQIWTIEGHLADMIAKVM